MGYPAWPASLPQKPLRDGFGNSGEQPVRRQQMESGLDRVQLISSTAVRNNQLAFVMDEAQLAEFWSFYNNAANQGADFVLLPMYTGNTVAMHVSRINSYPSMDPLGVNWRVSFGVETSHQVIDWSE